MKIVILADPIDDQKAGVHVYTKHLIESLLKTDHINRYIFIHKSDNPYFDQLKERYPDIKHYIIPKKSHPLAGTYRKFFAIPKLLKKLQPDLVFEPCHIGPFRTPKGCKRVTMIHDLTPILMPQYHIKKSTIIHKLLLKKVIKDADLLITASKSTKKDILSHYKTDANIAVIPLGIYPPKITKEDTPLIKVLKTGIPPSQQKAQNPNKKNTPYLLYLGTIEPRKNLETLIAAFTELKTELPQARFPHKLVLAGEIGWKADHIKELAQQHPEIELKGYISEKEKPELYQNASMFIYPSLYEGFGLPPLEAMSYKIPVICADTSSLREYYQNYSLLFPPTDTQALKTHITTLLDQKKPSQQMIERAFLYSQKFRWETSANQTIDAWSRLKT